MDSDKKNILRKIRREESLELSKRTNLKTQIFKNKKSIIEKNLVHTRFITH